MQPVSTVAQQPATSPERISAILAQLESVVLGKPHELRLSLACLLAGGHLLIEDLPGVGKTTLAHALATTLGMSFQRVQFTSDMLPADLLGVSIYSRENESFTFHPGPVFSQVVLADEVNRASPKTQSALLEAMEEMQVTADGQTHALPRPFFVIATQNPQDQMGTFPLPESQLDRFLMRVHLGYPSADAERALLLGEDRQALLARLQPAISPGALEKLQADVERVHVAPALLDYVQAVVAFTRAEPRLRHGLSPRAAIRLVRGARAWALMRGADAVAPDDVQAVARAVIGHRLAWRDATDTASESPADYVLNSVPVD